MCVAGKSHLIRAIRKRLGMAPSSDEACLLAAPTGTFPAYSFTWALHVCPICAFCGLDSGVAAGVIGQGCRTLHGLLGIAPPKSKKTNGGGETGGGLDIHKATSAVKLEAVQAKVSPKAIAFTIDEVSMLGGNMLFITSTIFGDALSSQEFRTRDLPFAGFPILKLVGTQLLQIACACFWLYAHDFVVVCVNMRR